MNSALYRILHCGTRCPLCSCNVIRLRFAMRAFAIPALVDAKLAWLIDGAYCCFVGPKLESC